MISRNLIWAALALAAAAGCATVRRAHEAQEAVADKSSDGASAAAAPVDLRGRSLEALVAFAMTNRPSVTAARLAVEDARLALKELAADAPLLSDTPWTAPRLSLEGGYSEASRGSTLRDADFRTSGSPSAGLSLDLLIWDFGRYDARAAAQAENVVAAELSLVEEGYRVFGQVSAAYFTVMEHRALLGVALTNEAQHAAHLARAEERFKAGEANKLDVLKARLDLATSRQKVVAASNSVDTAGAELMNALGVEASRGTYEEVFGDDPVGYESVFRAFAHSTCDVAEAFAFARTNAPAVRLTRARLRAASHNVDYAVADLGPSVTASVSVRWTDPLWIWNWGLNAVQSLFQGFRKTTAVDRAVVAMKQAATAVDEIEQTLSVDLETAIAVRDNSQAAVKSAVASVKSARENLETVQEQLSVGSVSRIELSEAIASDSEARGNCISAFYDGQRAEAALYALLGSYPVYHEELVKGGNLK